MCSYSLHNEYRGWCIFGDSYRIVDECDNIKQVEIVLKFHKNHIDVNKKFISEYCDENEYPIFHLLNYSFN